MKKILSFFIAAIASLNVFGYETVKSDRLHVWAEFPEKIIADGTTVNYITVYQHDDDDLDYVAFNMEFILPDGFRVNKVKSGRNEVNDIMLSERASATHTISCNLLNGDDLRIISTSSQNDYFYKDDEDGNLLDELFTVGLIAEPTLLTGDYTIRMEGIVFVHKSGDAKIPQLDDPTTYNVFIDNPEDTTGIEAVEGESLDPEDCFDILGHRVDPRKVRGMIVISKGRKVYVK